MDNIWVPVPSKRGVLARADGYILLPPRYAPLPQGGYRIYTPEPTAGYKTRSSKTAKHVYLGLYSREHGNIKVHQAICEAFHGPKPFAKAVVIHLDEDATNNTATNLKWGTQKENLNAPGFIAYCKSGERKAKIAAGRAKASGVPA